MHLILTSFLLSWVYYKFFFSNLLIWNGYFIQTVFFFHFKIPFFFNFDYAIALDGLNVWLLWLTSLLVFLCSLFLWENFKNNNFFLQMGWVFLLQLASLQFFCVTSYFWMYIFFELSLLPIYILIIFWGSN